MIGLIRGKIVEKFGASVVVEVGSAESGVGYEVFVSATDFAKFGLEDFAKFYVFHSVRENSEELYGFSSLVAKRIFELLLTVQGVGPKAALAILSLDEPEKVRNVIANDDAKFIAGAAGVGKKTAERVVLDLREKVGLPTKVYDKSGEVFAKNPQEDEALDALMALGFTLADGTKMLENVSRELSTEGRIREALKRK
jgi:Holliday junction DNA helicase RuvA